jgi:serine/threonine-protein kinase RsbW
MSAVLSVSFPVEPTSCPFRPEAWHHETITALAEVRPVVEAVTAAMTRAGYAHKDVFGVELSLEEALVNGIKHGNKFDPSKEVRVRYHVGAGHVVIEVEDDGPGFDLAAVPDPLADENLDRTSGRGLLLMRSYLTSVRHNERGNRVTLCKHRSAPRAGRRSA